jgi:hypothetical protein
MNYSVEAVVFSACMRQLPSRGSYLAMPGPVYGISMIFRSTSLRALLSLALILNGSAFAMPSMHSGMDVEPGAHASSPAHEQTAAQPSCHEMPVERDAGPTRTADSDHQLASKKSPVPDCCEHGKCACTCIHALAAIPTIAMNLIAEFQRPVIRIAERGCPSPVLPQLSRPPIA